MMNTRKFAYISFLGVVFFLVPLSSGAADVVRE
jgi:hypothetical protein